MSLIEVYDIVKIYRTGDVELRALDGVSFSVEQGEFVSIMGHSGSGKSTMMNVLGCLDVPDGGTYFLDGKEVGSLPKDIRRNTEQKDRIRVQGFCSKRPLPLKTLSFPSFTREYREKSAKNGAGLPLIRSDSLTAWGLSPTRCPEDSSRGSHRKGSRRGNASHPCRRTYRQPGLKRRAKK